MSLLSNFSIEKLKEKLQKTRNAIFGKITETLSGKAIIDEGAIEQIEEILLTSDMGIEITNKVISTARKNLINESNRNLESIKSVIKNELLKIVELGNRNGFSETLKNPKVILVVGINGSGKTTTVGKLAYHFKSSGKSTLIISADTFRAAANEQLDIWAKKAGVEIRNSQSKDPSAVIYDSLKYSLDSKTDIVLVDTAGRLHNQINLMNELSKIRKVIEKFTEFQEIESLMVIDASTGQNAIKQAYEFSRAVKISALVLTKLEGTAKGGIVFNICHSLNIPVKYIGIGESLEDLVEFEPESFINAII